jgi:hypothetical protein
MMLFDLLKKCQKSFTNWFTLLLRQEQQMTQLTNNESTAEEDQVEGIRMNVLHKANLKLKRSSKSRKEMTDGPNKDRQRMEELTRQIETLESEIDSLKRGHQEKDADYKGRMAVLDREIRGIQRQHQNTEELLAAKSSELKAAQTFLSKTDIISEFDVLQIVHDLNSQIMQVAATLAEGVCRGTSQQFSVHEQLYKYACDVYGPLLAQLLAQGDPEALQIAFQVEIIHVVQHITKVWGFDTDSSILDRIYFAIRASGNS